MRLRVRTTAYARRNRGQSLFCPSLRGLGRPTDGQRAQAAALAVVQPKRAGNRRSSPLSALTNGEPNSPGPVHWSPFPRVAEGVVAALPRLIRLCSARSYRISVLCPPNSRRSCPPISRQAVSPSRGPSLRPSASRIPRCHASGWFARCRRIAPAVGRNHASRRWQRFP